MGNTDTSTIVDNDDIWDEELPFLDTLKEMLIIRILPMVVMGSGRLGLMHKFQVLMHAIFLVASHSVQGFIQWIQSIVTSTTDQGVEFGLPSIPSLPLRQWLPWLPPGQRFSLLARDNSQEPQDDIVLSDDDMEDLQERMAAIEELENPPVSMQSVLSVCGLLHIIHNAGNSLLGACPQFDECVDGLSEVCDLIRRPTTCQRLCEKCFNTPIGQQFHKQLKAFNGQVYRERWGTVAYAVGQLLLLKACLVRFWDAGRYMHDAGQEEQNPAAAAKLQVKLEKVDQCLKSELWWGMLLALEKIMAVVRQCLEWAGGCMCHSHLDWSQVSRKVRQRWEKCKMRGRRLPELASGDFFKALMDFAYALAANLYVDLSAELEDTERMACIREFESGRAHLLMSLTMKLGHCLEPPFVVFGIAHPSRVVVTRILELCLASQCPHPQIRELQQPPLCDEAEQYIAGESEESLPALEALMGKLRFGWSAERLVEAGHALLNRFSAGRTYRTEAFDSLNLRFPELEDCMSTSFEMLLDNLAWCRNPRRLVAALGLHEHPSIAG